MRTAWRRIAALVVTLPALLLFPVGRAGARSDNSLDPTGAVWLSFAANPLRHHPSTVNPLAPGTDLPFTLTQQVMVADRTSGSHGTWARYEWRGTEVGWQQVNLSAGSRFGYGGVKPGNTRYQGDGSTPEGTYRIIYTFGPGNPGAKLEYRTVTPCSYWVGETWAADYNRWRESCNRPVGGEHLADYTSNLYRQAAVIGFNYEAQVRTGPGSGSAIFLHYATGSTAGCVGIDNAAELTETVKWLDPAKNPVIVIRS